MSWLPDRAKFDDEQNRIFEEIIDDNSRSWWIKGYAGTGKTMLLAHLAYEYLDAGYDCIYVTFTHALKDLVTDALGELGAKNPSSIVCTVDSIHLLGQTFDLVLVDEVQDLTEFQINRLLSLGKRFVYAGDLNQSIFLQAAKSQKISKLLGSPKQVELRDIHRLPEAISFAAHLIYSDAESAENALVDVVEDSTVNLVSAKSENDEVMWVYEQAVKESRPGKPSAIVFSRHKELIQFLNIFCNQNGFDVAPIVNEKTKDYEYMNEFLARKGIPLMYFGGDKGGEIATARKNRKILLMTIHNAKGLEFDSLFMPFMSDDRLICPYPSFKNHEDWQRRFLYVAITRTKLNFYASYSRDKNYLLDDLEDENLSKYLNYFEVV
jgi:superfamily I DNA/RNA helicase